ncbi:MAG: tail fiber protein [Spirochaetales bacterium]|nr:tail fiber protein [Spirochaetales bacterium]
MKKIISSILFFFLICLIIFAQDAMTILGENGNVGIGTENPVEKLEVSGNARINGEIQASYNGEVRSIMPFLVPIGTILPFAGPAVNIPEGWLLCDGSSLVIEEYRELYDVIGMSWGFGGTTFRVPDLRGQFMRGVDHETGMDPDADARHSLYNGGASGNAVGSFQNDAFQGHYHHFTRNYRSTADDHDSETDTLTGGGGRNDLVAGPINGTHGVVRVSTETRGKNAYVNFIIKY